MILREVFYPIVEGQDLIGRTADRLNDWFTIANFVITHGKQRSQHHANAVGGRKFRHRSQVILNCLERRWTSVAGEVVCPSEYHNNSRLKLYDVAAKANEHLRCCLSADATIYVRLAWEEAAVCRIVPRISNRVAH